MIMKLLAILMLLTASSSSLQRSQGNRATPVQERKELHLDIPRDDWEPIFFEEINERARLSNLKTLREGPLPDGDFEVRIWHGFGRTALEGFVLKRTGDQWSAMHLDGIYSSLPRNRYDRILRTPKSGWEKCWQRLEKTGILTLPDASAIGCDTSVMDGMSYVVEFNRVGIYRTYLYDNPSYAKCHEAKQMIKIANIISKEFGVPEMVRWNNCSGQIFVERKRI